jgi:uncharacterized membrane protein
MRRKHAALGLFWLVAGANHFRAPRMYDAIMPRALQPWARPLTYASGVAELAGGAAVLHPGTRRVGRWWLLATLAGVFPANVEMALHAERFPKLPAWGLWARLPLQLVAGWWVWKAAGD